LVDALRIPLTWKFDAGNVHDSPFFTLMVLDAHDKGLIGEQATLWLSARYHSSKKGSLSSLTWMSRSHREMRAADGYGAEWKCCTRTSTPSAPSRCCKTVSRRTVMRRSKEVMMLLLLAYSVYVTRKAVRDVGAGIGS
jgi:hypothetical protein